jgi:putative membrane protein
MKRLAGAALLLAAPAAAHDGSPHDPEWTLDPVVTLPLLLSALIYGVGLVRLHRRARGGRGLIARQARLYVAGWLTLAAAVVSPLHEAGETSFTMHMIEHEIIMLVAALLLVASRPGPALLWGLPVRLRRLAAAAARWPAWRRAAEPVAATAIQALVIWVWHVPLLFDLALRHEGWHIAQHLSFVVGALLFWWAMVHGRNEGLSALCLFVTSMVGGALGALMALSASPWYPAYAQLGMTPAGLTPMEDQHLAGLLMWVPGGLFHLAAALWFLARWLSRKEAPRAATAK